MALAVSPDSAQLLNNLGLVYAGKKQNDEAIAYFQRSMRVRPNYTDAHLNLGRLTRTWARNSEAELQLQAAVALAPLSVETRNELGSFYLAAGRLPEADAQFRHRRQAFPTPRPSIRWETSPSVRGGARPPNRTIATRSCWKNSTGARTLDSRQFSQQRVAPPKLRNNTVTGLRR